MTCKDCVHFDVCVYDNATTEYSDLCSFVKNKADFVEVVRCKDCIFLLADEKNGVYVCSETTNPNYVPQDHFCSYGERKEGDNGL